MVFATPHRAARVTLPRLDWAEHVLPESERRAAEGEEPRTLAMAACTSSLDADTPRAM